MGLKRMAVIHAVACSIILVAPIVLLVSQDYADFSVVRMVYLPILAVVVVAISFSQYVFGYVFAVSTGLGLIVEYGIHLSQENPNMLGAFVNTFIIACGFTVGIAAQFLVRVRRNQEILRP